MYSKYLAMQSYFISNINLGSGSGHNVQLQQELCKLAELTDPLRPLPQNAACDPSVKLGRISPDRKNVLDPLKSMSEDDKEDFMGSPDDDRGLVVEESRPEVKRPPLYQVVLLNDDYTPMEFVVEVLEMIFGMDRPKATRIMLEVHTKGKGRCGVFTYEIAETKVAQVSSYARQNQHPLLSTLEEV
jgi:ATP-dependent Clp protease adaptor protein ClpS